MAKHTQIIHIESLAPAKPVTGAVCNGCGVCCLVEPCPLGMVLSRKREGACVAVRWSASERQYRCGAITAPREVLQLALPTGLRWLSPAVGRLVGRLARRWVAAGSGCDSNLQALPPPPVESSTMQP